jgi:lysozyme family protein
MPSEAFESALPFVLRWEGGFVDHPKDPGGRTNKGVTQKVYNAWRSRQGQAPADVKAITDSEVHAIYEADYWLPPRCDLLSDPLTLVQFDTAVNMGVGRAVRFLQEAVGCGVDGDFGPGTAKAVQGCDTANVVTSYCNSREAFYRRLAEKKPDLAVFLKGWLNRLNSLRKEIGLPGYESARGLDFGDASYIRRIPDIGESRDFDI